MKENISTEIQDENARILIELINKYGSEFIDCTQISYYVDGELQFKKPGRIMANRRDRFPKLQILAPDTGDYTESFQEDSCVFIDISNLDIIKIKNIYSPKAIGKEVCLEVIITI